MPTPVSGSEACRTCEISASANRGRTKTGQERPVATMMVHSTPNSQCEAVIVQSTPISQCGAVEAVRYQTCSTRLWQPIIDPKRRQHIYNFGDISPTYAHIQAGEEWSEGDNIMYCSRIVTVAPVSHSSARQLPRLLDFTSERS